MGHFGWPKITFNRISRHFRSIRNFCILFCFAKWPPADILDARFWPKSIKTSLYSRSVATSNIKLIGTFVIKLWSAQFCHHICTNWPPAAILIFSKIDRVLPIWVINGCVKYEFDTRIRVTATCNTSLCVRRRRRRRPDQNHNIPEIWNFGDIINDTHTIGWHNYMVVGLYMWIMHLIYVIHGSFTSYGFDKNVLYVFNVCSDCEICIIHCIGHALLHD